MSKGTAREFLLPDLGEGLTEAEIISWHVAVGDTVAVDQVVVEVETAKAAVEVPCPFGGVVVELFGAVGDVIDVGKPLISVAPVGSDNRPQVVPAPEEPADRARLDAETREKKGSGNVLIGYGTPEGEGNRRRRRVVSGFGGHAPAPVRPHGGRLNGGAAGLDGGAASARGVAGSSGASGFDGGADSARGVADSGGATGFDGGATSAREVAGSGGASVFGGSNGIASASDVVGSTAAVAGKGVRVAVVSPLVRRLAKERGLDLASIPGTGPEGLILRRDVEAALTAPAPIAAPTGIAELERIPLRGVRKAVADKLTRSRREIPDATTWVDVDATALTELREKLNRDPAARRISLLALFARICVAGLARYPELNATVDVERQEIVRLADVNLGFAAQTDRGLVVPVIHGAHRMTTEQLAAELERLTTAAREGTLGVADLTGSTFTLNNYGVYGVDGSTPILNHPEAAMLGVGRIVKKPWVVSTPDGGDELAIRKVTQLSFTFDHRVCDGGVAGGFLRYVADLVEEPARLLRGL